ncbi:MAG: PHP domain-containing protein [Dehalococcoidales bacterium]|nr:PHP domain-containing protein [Dehalococcoidales bacterium]
MELEDIIERCRKMEIDCIAITDHGTVEGGLKMQELAPFKVIVGEEVLTDYGEIMGMFLKETIPSNITVDEAISRIKDQGGLVCLPHPFDPLRGLTMDMEEVDKLAPRVDIVEVFNARSPINSTADKALDYALRHNIPATVGSDSHTLGEIGRTFVEIDDFETPDQLLEVLKNGRISQHKASIFVHFSSTITKIKRKIRK